MYTNRQTYRSGVLNPQWGNFPQQDNLNPPTLTYQDTHVIQTKQLKTTRKIPYRLFVRSLDRNFLLYPNPNYFQINLPEDYREILQIRLKNAKLPQSIMNIKKTNNLFYFQEVPETVQQIRIPVGNYDATTLATKLQTEINNVSMATIHVTTHTNDGGITNFFEIDSDFSNGAQFFRIVTFDPSCLSGTQSSTFTVDQKTNMNQFQPLPNPLFPTIGYDRKDYLYLPSKVAGYQGDTTVNCPYLCFSDYYQIGDVIRFQDATDTQVYTITGIPDEHTLTVNPALNKTYMDGIVYLNRWKAPFRFSNRAMDTVLIRIEELSYIRPAYPFMKDLFAIVYNNLSGNAQNNNYIFVNESDNEMRDYNPPIPRLTKLTIEFLDMNGERYDFEEDNLFLDFEITCVNSPPALEDKNSATI